MLVNTKAKVGVFPIALGAYLPQFPSLVPEFEAQYDAFKKTIPDTVEIVDGGMVTTKEQAMVAGDKFRAADVDLVFLQMLTYATSYNMLPAIRDLDVPVNCGGAVVQPGDYIFGDSDGVLVVPEEHIDLILNQAVLNMEYEKRMEQAINENADSSAIAEVFKTKVLYKEN